MDNLTPNLIKSDNAEITPDHIPGRNFLGGDAKLTKPKAQQIRWTVPMGNDLEGKDRLARYKQAALAVMKDPKLFNAWIRHVLDAETARILKA